MSGTSLEPSPETAVPRRRAAILEPFASRDFSLLWSGLLVSNVGTWMQFTAIGYDVATLAPNAEIGSFYIGLVGAARAVPVLLLSPVAGFVADRYPRRLVLLYTNGATTLLAALFAILIATGHGALPVILVLSAGAAAAQAFDAPARQSWTPLLVPRAQVGTAIGLNSIAFNAPSVVGPPVAGILIATEGIAWCFAANALATLGVLLAIALMRPAPLSRERHGSMWRSIGEGLRFLYAHPVLRWVIFLLVLTSLTVRSYNFLLPAYSVHVLHVDARALGWLLASSGSGAIVGALTTALGDPRRRATQWFVAALVLSAGVIALGASAHFPVALVVLFVIGAATLSFISASNVLIQTLAPDNVRGRAVSVYSMILLGLVPLGSLLLGALANAIGLRATFAAAGAVALVATIWTFVAHPRLRRS